MCLSVPTRVSSAIPHRSTCLNQLKSILTRHSFRTADFHGEEGAGNLGTGSFTFLDGQVKNIYSGPFSSFFTGAATRKVEAAPPSASITADLAGAVSSSPTTGGPVTVEATPTNTSGQLTRSTAARDSAPLLSSTNISLGFNGNNSGASSLRLLDITDTSLAVLVGSLYGWTLIFQ
jgi:hypothetical protein